MAASPAERKAAERRRKKEAGLVKVDAWIRPEQRERLAKYLAKLNKEQR